MTKIKELQPSKEKNTGSVAPKLAFVSTVW